MRKVIVRDQQFNPLHGVDVELFDPDTGRLLKVARTDQTGMVSFDATGRVAYRPRITRHAGKLGANSLSMNGATNLYPLPIYIPPEPVKVTEPPSAPPATLQATPIVPCDLLILNEDGSDTFVYRAVFASEHAVLATWTTSASIGDTTFMPYTPMINKGSRIAYPGDSHFYISADRGVSWTERAFPTTATFAPFLDRVPNGRFWTAGYDDFAIYYSDDELASWTSAVTFSCTYVYGINVSLGDSNHIVVTHDNVGSSALYVTVSTDGGATWASHEIGSYLNGIVLYQPSGRLLAIAIDSAAHNVYGLYSDDDGATWSSPTTLATLSGADYFRLVDWRVSRRGTIFAAIDNGNTDVNVGIIRTADGESWEVLGPLDSSDVSALAYCDSTGNLYVVHQSVGVYVVPSAAVLASGSWISSAMSLSNAPAGAYASNVFAAYMVTI